MTHELKDAFLRDPVSTLVFRPGHRHGRRLNVFTRWADVYAAVEKLRGLGALHLEFDDRFAPTRVPAGTWIMNDVLWTHYNSGITPTVVELDDGASIRVIREGPTEEPVLTICGTNMIVRSNRKGPVAPFVGVNLVLSGTRTRIGNSDPLALPMFVATGNNFIAISGTDALGGIGDGEACPAPVIDCAGHFVLIAGGHGFISDNALTDTAGGGSVVVRLLNDGFTGGSFPGQSYDFPALVAGGGTLSLAVQSRDRHLVNARVTATPYDATFNEAVLVDTSALAITVNAPRANPARGERLVVKDVSGNAAAHNITVIGTGGDTVENGAIATNGQAKTWIADGAGTWVHIATS